MTPTSAAEVDVDRTDSATSTGSLGRLHGVAIYTAAILGAGVLVLPSLAAEAAGPASLIAWVGLLLFCIPVAFTFAALAGRYPDAGGVSTFVRVAFGDRAATVVGYWFFFALPFGAPATALTGARYLSGEGATDAVTWIAALLLLAALVTTSTGLRLSGALQLGLASALAAVLATAFAGNVSRLAVANFEPFTPHGVGGIASAASLLFFSFAGWEAVTHIAHEFPNPARDVRVVTASTLAVISVLYLGLAIVSIGVLGPELPRSTTPVTDLLSSILGSGAPILAGAVAACLAYGAMSAYLSGASRLGAALARDGVLWSRLAHGHQAGQTPRASTLVLGVLCLVMLAGTTALDIPLADLVGVASTLFLAVTCAGVLAGIRLLPRLTLGWWGAVGALALLTPVLIASGRQLLVPAALGLAGLYVTRSRQGRPS